MRTRTRLLATTLVLVALTVAVTITPGRAQDGDNGDGDGPQPATLTDDDRELLEQVLELVTDPKGRECVMISGAMWSCWRDHESARRIGWLERDEDGEPVRVFDLQGPLPELPNRMETVADYAAGCRRRFADAGEEDGFARMRATARGPWVPEPALVAAAWLWRLGHEETAKLALAHIRYGPRHVDDDGTLRTGTTPGEILLELRRDLAWRDFAGAVHAFINGADADAWPFAERFVAEHADEFDTAFGTSGRALFDELKRRKEAGTFGSYRRTRYEYDRETHESRAFAQLPDGFADWSDDRRTEWLVHSLEDIDARQMGQPGGVDLAADWRVLELIKVGDPAVPALIDVIEKDPRLTRTMHMWRDFARSRTVLGVHEPALVAVMAILQVKAFEAVSTGDSFTARGASARERTAATLRAYWEKFGGLPYDERQAAVLADDEMAFDARLQALENLAYPGRRVTYGTTVFTGGVEGTPVPGPNPAIEKFDDPTVAEAAVAAMRGHVAKLLAEDDYRLERTIWRYAAALQVLDDRRVRPQLVAWVSDEDQNIYVRVIISWLCHEFGDSGPMEAFSKEFAAATLAGLDAIESYMQLDDIVHALAHVRHPAARAALEALAQPDHPMHGIVRERVVRTSPDSRDARMWFATITAVRILRPMLDDVETRADAARKLAAFVAGLPKEGPLDERVATIRELIDRYGDHIRLATVEEAKAFKAHRWGPLMLIDPPPLGRCATAEDVAKGHAVFALDNAVRVADLKLPALGSWDAPPEPDADGEVTDDRQWFYICQAEVDADGTTWYGVIDRHEIRRMAAPYVKGLRSLADDAGDRGD